MGRKTLTVDDSTHSRLDDLKDDGESFDDVIVALLDHATKDTTSDRFADTAQADVIDLEDALSTDATLTDEQHRQLVDDIAAAVEGRVDRLLNDLAGY